MVSRSTTRRAARAAVVLAATLAVAGLAACGEQEAGGPPVASSSGDAVTPSTSPSGPGSPDAGSPASGSPDAAEQSITVTLDDGSGGKQTWTLTCSAAGAPGGDHPDAVNACAALAALTDPFRPVPKDMACTMVYGGPQTATVQGRWGGKDVLTTFKRTDGCEIARWNRIAPLLQPGQPVTQGTHAG